MPYGGISLLAMIASLALLAVIGVSLFDSQTHSGKRR